MALTLDKLRTLVKTRNKQRNRKLPFALATAAQEAGVYLPDLGPILAVEPNRVWQTPFGDLIELTDGRLRINDEGGAGA